MRNLNYNIQLSAIKLIKERLSYLIIEIDPFVDRVSSIY